MEVIILEDADAQLLRSELRHTFLWFVLECPASLHEHALEQFDPLFETAVGKSLTEIILNCARKLGH